VLLHFTISEYMNSFLLLGVACLMP
jgi:hypothetical protein